MRRPVEMAADCGQLPDSPSSQSDAAEHLPARTANSLPSRRRGGAGGAHGGRHARPASAPDAATPGAQRPRAEGRRGARAPRAPGAAGQPAARRKTGNLKTSRCEGRRQFSRFPGLRPGKLKTRNPGDLRQGSLGSQIPAPPLDSVRHSERHAGRAWRRRSPWGD